MNEDLKRLIEVLNNAGYEVIEIKDEFADVSEKFYNVSTLFSLKVFDTAKGRSKS